MILRVQADEIHQDSVGKNGVRGAYVTETRMMAYLRGLS